MNIEIYKYTPEEIQEHHHAQLNGFQLWVEDLEEAGIEKIFLAWDGGQIVGFQAISWGFETSAIEVLDEYQGKGIARELIWESGCFRPEQNYCPEFWAKMAAEEEEG